MSWTIARAVVAYRLRIATLRDRIAAETGEGVISTAIAVLIVALLGAAMWMAFRGIFDGTTERTGSAVDTIGG